MNKFTYYNPTKIEFGKEKENNIGEYLKQSNIKKVLLVYGGGSTKKNGLYEKIITSLNRNNIKFEELSGVVSNPVLSKVYEGIELAKNNEIEAIAPKRMVIILVELSIISIICVKFIITKSFSLFAPRLCL